MFSMSSIIFILIFQIVLSRADLAHQQSPLIENIRPDRFFFSIYDKYFSHIDYVHKDATAVTTTTTESSDSSEYDIIPTPPSVGNKPVIVSFDEPIYTNKGPQPFTILMNFQNDGTTSLQILSQQNLFWSDIGNCRHGQMFEPITGICRDVFCIQGYVLGPNGCVADANFNSTEYNKPIKKPAAEMNIQIALTHKLCTYIRDHNDTIPCDHLKVMNTGKPLLNGLKNSLSKILKINEKRIDQVKLVSYEVINETSINFLNREKRSIHKLDIDDNDGLLFKKDTDSEETRSMLIQVTSLEVLKFSFTIRDQKLFDNESKETIILFYYLNMLAMDERYFNIKDHKSYLTEVVQIKEAQEEGWCDSPDVKLPFRDKFRILASFDDLNKPKYYVYVNQTETLYGTGYYYLTVLYTTKPGGEPTTTKKSIDKNDLSSRQNFTFDPKRQQIIADYEDIMYKRDLKSHLSLLYLSDVTDIVLDQNSTSVASSKLLYVCNRKPKIRVTCKNYETIRVRLCELKLMKDRSFCSLILKKCYLLDEYEYDPIEPDTYIRVCKTEDRIKPFISELNIKTDVNKTISGWVSFLSTVISLIFMFFTLFTYFMFKKIRNLPSWNIINVTLALTIAHFCFLLGSFLNLIPLVCFLLSIITHYGFLASFFWMNVIAFDIYRNFCNKSSLVLIHTIRLKERLPKYFLYAWIIPFFIVLIGLIVDLKVTSPNSRFRPCYSGYLKGCSIDSETFLLNNNETNSTRVRRELNKTESCYGDKTLDSKILVINGPCWIQNGRANLIYFGLPIGIIIIVNAIFYFLTIYNIRKRKNEQKEQLRRISSVKQPGDEDVKFYIQMACIMGFTWIIGFFLTTSSSNSKSSLTVEIVYNILTYLFILLNASTGVFIFFAFIFRKDVINLYKNLLSSKFSTGNGSVKKNSVSFIGRFGETRKSRMRENSSSSTTILDYNSGQRQAKNSISSTTSSTTEQLNTFSKGNVIFESQETQGIENPKYVKDHDENIHI